MNSSGRAALPNSLPKEAYNHVIMQEDVDNYINTVTATLSLINVLQWDESERKLDPEARYGIGRRMTTSKANKVSPMTDITPDVVSQRRTQGVIGEITYSLTLEDEHWREKLEQIVKYDDHLTGWWTKDEKIDSHDIALLVPRTRAVKVGDILEKEAKDKNGTIKLKRMVAVIGFDRSSGATKEFMNLMKFYGALSDTDLSERLRNGIAVPTDILLRVYGDRKLVDFEPPTPYLLQVLWDSLFPSYIGEVPVDQGKGHTPIEVSVERIVRDMQNNFGFRVHDDRCTEVPPRAWIKKALDHLVVFAMASRHDDGAYTIRYKSLRGDHLKRFGELIHRNRNKLMLLAGNPQQSLFESKESTIASRQPAEKPIITVDASSTDRNPNR